MLRWLLNKIAPEDPTPPPIAETIFSEEVSTPSPPPDLRGLLRRRAVYNREWEITAYAFSLRELAQAQSTDEEHSHDEVLLCEIERLIESKAIKSDVWIELRWKNLHLLSKHRFATTRPLHIIANGDVTQPEDELLVQLGELHQQNFLVGAVAQRWHKTHGKIGSQLKLMVLVLQSPDFATLSNYVQACRKIAPHAELWVNDVDSREAAEACFQLGVDYVSGKVFTWPEAQQLNFPDQFLRLNQILKLVRQNADAKIISTELKSDPALSARLLRYVNSAAMGLTQSVSNLDQAVVIVGNQRLYRWLSLLLFASQGEDKLDQTLLEAALTRARLMELAGLESMSAVECDLLFLTGLFSLLDFLLRVPRSLLLKELCPPDIVVDTLSSKATPFSPFLQLAEQSETGQPSEALLAQCQLTFEKYNRVQIDATLWTLSALAT
ncbi:EAL and HDOD domain-containing protein [Chitinibacter sp. S2-10]|uniref:EAL and HDOD domain-containing protein n=1 Tax=Chitinibacter sp. S2-10 TaxID=3373597 RepID=UPI00397746D2